MYSNGTKHPHRNDVPSATTFTIPPIAALFEVMFPIKNPILRPHKANTRELSTNAKPFAVNMVSLNKIKLSIM